jgi:hypothetical protein
MALAGTGIFCQVGPCRAAAQGQLLSSYAAQIPATSTLQVTGTADRFTIIADHADVRSLLSLVFGQAEKDFTLDSNVMGQVTMRLSGQSFLTVLSALCKQTFLRYQQNPQTGIYTFSRDAAAVGAAFSQLRDLNGQLAQQLRFMGLNVPMGYGVPLSSYNNTPNVAQNPYRFVPRSLNSSSQNLQLQGAAGPQGQAVPQVQAQAELNQARRGQEQQPAGALDNAGGGFGGGGGLRGGAIRGAVGTLNDKVTTSTPAQADAAADSLLNANNLVRLYIPHDQYVPVRDVLEQLAQQAKVPMLIDPQVPAGPKFRLNGSIPARTLPEALNLLAPTARLEWRWVGDTIYVTTTPDFQIFFGDSNVPRAAYPPASSSQSRAAGQKSASPASPKK